MTGFTGAQIIVPNATAVSGAPKISNDTIDVAIGTLSSFVFAYIRAKRWTSPAASGLADRTGYPITTQHTGQTFSATDADFGGMASVNVAACSDTPYVIPNRGSAPPAAFTFISALKVTTAQGSGKLQMMVSQTQGGTGALGIDFYGPQTPAGAGTSQSVGPQSLNFSAGFPTLGTACIFVCSYDPTTKIARAGLNGLPTNTVTFSTGPTPGSSDFFRLFGYETDNGNNMLGKFETVAIFNAAAGAGYTIDAPLSAAITSMRAVYGF